MKAFFVQGLRFGVVGLAATAVHYVVALAAVSAGFGPHISNGIGFAVAFLVSFAGHLRWSFREQGAEPGAALLRFSPVAVGGFCLNQAALAGLLRWTEWPVWFCLGLVLAGVAGGTFLVSKWWAFRRGVAEEEMEAGW